MSAIGEPESGRRLWRVMLSSSVAFPSHFLLPSRLLCCNQYLGEGAASCVRPRRPLGCRLQLSRLFCRSRRAFVAAECGKCDEGLRTVLVSRRPSLRSFSYAFLLAFDFCPSSYRCGMRHAVLFSSTFFGACRLSIFLFLTSKPSLTAFFSFLVIFSLFAGVMRWCRTTPRHLSFVWHSVDGRWRQQRCSCVLCCKIFSLFGGAALGSEGTHLSM